MTHAELSCTEFYSCHLQQCHSIDLFSYRTPDHGHKGHMNKFCRSFCSEVFLELALQFFLELHMVLAAHVVLCMAARFFENHVLPLKWGKQDKPRVLWKNLVFFSQFFIFSSIWSIMKVYITVILVCLNKFHIWENPCS